MRSHFARAAYHAQRRRADLNPGAAAFVSVTSIEPRPLYTRLADLRWRDRYFRKVPISEFWKREKPPNEMALTSACFFHEGDPLLADDTPKYTRSDRTCIGEITRRKRAGPRGRIFCTRIDYGTYPGAARLNKKVDRVAGILHPSRLGGRCICSDTSPKFRNDRFQVLVLRCLRQNRPRHGCKQKCDYSSQWPIRN
jgi:hypothetical protein